MANTKLQTKPSFFPDMPASLDGKAHWAGRTFGVRFTDTGAKGSDSYITTGIFPAPQSSQRGDTDLIKAMTVIFDLDIVDLYNNDGFLKRALEVFAQQGVEIVYSTNATKKTAFDLPSFSAEPLNDANAERSRKADRKHIVKAFLTSLPQADLVAMVEEEVPPYLAILEEYLGKPQQITYSGGGAHFHYALAETEGWTDAGLALLPEDERDDKLTNIAEWKGYYKAFNAHVGRQLDEAFDDKCSDVGTCVTREVGSANNKHSTNSKQVTPIFQDRIDPTGCLTLAGLKEVPVPEPVKAKKKKGAAQAIKDAKGRTHDARVKRVPARLNGSEEITYAANGVEVTITVSELMETWDQLKGAGHTVVDAGGEKLKCRLDWLSSGSLNAWCRFQPDPEGGDRDTVMFICDVDKYLNANDRHVHETNGKLIGLWVYEGSIFSQLTRTAKGALEKRGANYSTILTLDPRVANKIRENVRTKTIEVHSSINVEANSGNPHVTGWAKMMDWMPLTDRHINYFRSEIIEAYYGCSISREDVFNAIDSVASSNGYDPVTSWIESVQWDGKRRLDGDGAWLPRVMHMTKSHDMYDYYSFIGRSVMLGITRNIFNVPMEPTLCQHMMLVTGPQNAGKSTFAATIAGVDYLGRDYYGDSDIDLTKQADLMITMRGKSVMEIPELAAFNKRDFDTIKSFVTRARMEAREPYARTTTKENKATYFIGTTNAFVPLGDPTGNRRFLVVDFYKDMAQGRRWDLKHLRAIIPQLYAEAYQRVVLGQNIPADRAQETRPYCGSPVEDWNLTTNEILLQEAKNTSYTAVEQTTEAIQAYLTNLLSIGKYSTTYELLRKELRESHYIDRVPANRILSEVLGREGWESVRNGGKRIWRYTGEKVEANPSAKATLSGVNIALETPDVAPPAAPQGSSSEMQAMMAMLAEMKREMTELRNENKELRSKLNDEPRRKAPAARKPAAPKAPAKIETPAQALVFLDAQGVSDDRIEAYRNAGDDDRRKPILGNLIVSLAQECAENN